MKEIVKTIAAAKTMIPPSVSRKPREGRFGPAGRAASGEAGGVSLMGKETRQAGALYFTGRATMMPAMVLKWLR